ncbi:MAG: SbcC/MukB-like Walker B domain-containing protein, partial [Burkholderiales bacterium]
RQLVELARWQRRVAEAEHAAGELRLAARDVERSEQQADAIRARLAAADYAHETQAQLAALAARSSSLGYDQQAHEAAKRTIQELVPRQKEFNDLTAAIQQRPDIVGFIQEMERSLAGMAQRIAAEEEEVQRLTVALQGRESLLRRVQEQQVVLNNLRAERVQADRYLGAARQKLEYAEQHAARQPEVEAAHHAAVEERTVYEQLVNAFGKRGVQAMIIEGAIPEIEAEANRLLGRMTDGRMSVSLWTQRESRSGDMTIETLDIVISDEYGERPYETFSGGEAFRINFALRIALSKLLTHRAGTNLRTLVIDEGFGSQDAQGRDRLVEAITSVQEDFERILVIT